MKLRLISFAMLALLTFASCRDKLVGPPVTLASSDTVAYWTFDGNAHDVSTNGRNATLSGTFNYIPDRFGNAGKAVEFIGNGQMNVQNMPNFTDDDSYTVSFWVNFSAGGSLLSQGYGFGADTGEFGAVLGGCGQITSSQSPGADKWRLITVAVSAHNSATLYIDTVQVAESAYGDYTGSNDSMPLQIAFNQLASGADTTLLDNALFLHYCLSKNQVMSRFHEGGWYEGKQSDTTSDTIAHWSGPTPIPSGILGMCWVNSTIGYACGKQGVIYETTDGGSTWQQQNQTATQSDLYAISFLQNEPNMGVAAGFSNGAVILLTSDAGNTWTQDALPPGVATIRDVITGVGAFPFSVAVGSDSAGNGIVLFSNYWGYWDISLKTPKPLYSITDDGQTNYLEINNPLIAVGDGGQIFVATAFSRIPDSIEWTDYSTGSENLRSISIIGGYPNFAGAALADDGSTLWSTDFGKTWTGNSQSISTYIPNSAIYIWSPTPLDEPGMKVQAWISGSNIAQTLDGGTNWNNDNPAPGLLWTCISGPSSHHIGFLSGSQLYWLTQ